MKRFTIPLVLLAAVGGAVAAEPTDREKAMAATSAFGKALKAELVTAMQAGGPLAAIEVCNSKAPAIAEAVSLDQGMEVSRVSLRNRNPDNAPNAWQAEVLASFEERIGEGEDAGRLIARTTRS